MTQREWREAKDIRASTIGIGSVLVSAAVLRFWALGHGIPYAVGVDEPEIMERAVRMMKTGDFNPHFFDYGGFYIYVQLIVASIRFMVGAASGAWQNLSQVDAADFYLWGRAVTAAIGTATVWLVYQIGSRWGTRHAVLAAGLMALLPIHVRESHYVLTDVPMAFLTTLALLLSLKAHEKGEMRTFAWAGAAVGLAAATKYHAIVALLFPLLAAVMTRGSGRPRLKPALIAVGMFVLAFLLAAPYTILDLPAFLNGFGRLAATVPLQKGGEPAWLVYLKHLRLAMGWPGLVLMFVGLGFFAVRMVTGPGQTRYTMVVAFVALYFPLIASRSLVFARYLMPLLPFACLLTAVMVVSGVSLLRRLAVPRWARTALIAALTVAAMLPAAIGAVRFDRQAGRKWTYAFAYEWVAANIPAGSSVVIEGYGLRLPEERYRVRHVKKLIDGDHESYVASGTRYLIASSQIFGRFFESAERYPNEYAAYRKLVDQARLLLIIEASPTRPGPELRIFEVSSPAGGLR